MIVEVRDVKHLAVFLAVLGVSLCVCFATTIYPYYCEHRSASSLMGKGYRVFFEEKQDWINNNITSYFNHVNIVYAPESHRLEASLNLIDAFPNLEILVLQHSDLKDDMLGPLRRLRKLRELDLQGTAFTDLGAAYLEECDNLENLNLRETRISNAGLSKLTRLSRLTNVDLSSTRIDGNGLVYLMELRGLEFLDLSNTGVDDLNLRYLLNLGRVRNLSLRHTDITDRGLALVGQLTNLEYLNLSSTRVSDTGIVHLSPLNRLNTLILSATEVSEKGIERLEKVIPGLYIDFFAKN